MKNDGIKIFHMHIPMNVYLDAQKICQRRSITMRKLVIESLERQLNEKKIYLEEFDNEEWDETEITKYNDKEI